MASPAFDDSAFALAFETSSARGEVALGRGETILETEALSGPRRHAAEFLPLIAGLCQRHRVAPEGVRYLFVSIGPGSFTGLRIGVTVARMLAMAHGAGIVAVPTLTAIVQNALHVPAPPQQVAVVLDAKRARVYAAGCSLVGQRYEAHSSAAEVDPAAFLAAQPRGCAVLGEGIAYHESVVAASGLPVLPETLWLPRAETVYLLGVAGARAGTFTGRKELVPLYIRPPEAEEKFRQRTGT